MNRIKGLNRQGMGRRCVSAGSCALLAADDDMGCACSYPEVKKRSILHLQSTFKLSKVAPDQWICARAAIKNIVIAGVVRGHLRRRRGQGLVFDGVADALRVPNIYIRLFGKPRSNARRRMGVALAFDADVEVARVNAKTAAAVVKPRAA